MPPFEMPELYLPFTVKVNPNVDTVRAHTKAWAQEMGMLDSAEDVPIWDEVKYDAADFALFAAYTHPAASSHELDFISDTHVWGWFADDYFVEVFKRSRDLAGARAFVDQLPAFMPMYPSLTPVPTNPVERGLIDVWSRASLTMSAGERHRFARGLLTMVRSWLWEISNLIHDRVPDPIDYIEMRRKTGGAQYSANTAIISVGAEIPPEVFRTRQIRLLNESFGDVTVLSNDIFSYRREIEFEGEINNGVLVFQRILDCDLRYAVNVFNDTLTSRVRRFEDATTTELATLFSELDLDIAVRENLLRHAEGLQDWIAGAYEWSRRNGRYNNPALWTPVPYRNPATSQRRDTLVRHLSPDNGATLNSPPDFPDGISLHQRAFRNWSGEIKVDEVWTAVPASADEVATLANWAHANGWKIRPKGMGHTAGPLVIPPGDPGDTLLVDTTAHLTSVTVRPGSPAAVTAQTGVTMERLLTELETAGYGLAAVPSPGEITLGGVLAVNAHGSVLPKIGETLHPGHTYGTLSNLITELKAVVWDDAAGHYLIKTFTRSAPEAGALLVNLGRSFVVEATIQVGSNQRLRCESIDHIPASTLFAPPASAGSDSIAAWVDQTGRVDVVWYSFTPTAWLRLFSVTSVKPPLSRQVNAPYNYSFADFVSDDVSDMLAQIIAGNETLTPAFQALQMASVSAGLTATGTRDIWGWSKNLQLNVRSSTLRLTSSSWAVLTSRANIQRVVSEFYAYCSTALNDYAQQDRYPVSGSIVLRITGLDDPDDVQSAGAVSPQLSAARSRPDHPEWDVVVWVDLTTTPGLPSTQQFLHETEQWILSNYSGSYATVRPEWSKGWGFSGTSAWSDPGVLDEVIPTAYRAGQSPDDNWDTAIATLNALDPHRIFSSTFLDTLLNNSGRPMGSLNNSGRPGGSLSGPTGLGTSAARLRLRSDAELERR